MCMCFASSKLAGLTVDFRNKLYKKISLFQTLKIQCKSLNYLYVELSDIDSSVQPNGGKGKMFQRVELQVVCLCHD